MKIYLVPLIFLFMAKIAVAQKEPITQEESNPVSKTSFNGKECYVLVVQLVDPKDVMSVNLTGVGPEDMLKSSGVKSMDVDVSLKEGAEVMNMTTFFEYYKVPVSNQEIIKVNSKLLKVRENFLASKTMISKVTFGTDQRGQLFTNIVTVNSKRK
ncbi:hypothetical protein QFZ20_004760 [Flavobacterium sp. W4I14]|nr:hypothetical protein [Flavobacterium sp. W4I14]